MRICVCGFFFVPLRSKVLDYTSKKRIQLN